MGSAGGQLVQRSQIAAIKHLRALFREHDTDFWLFGGWAVDVHAGRISRRHADIDIAVWAADSERIHSWLTVGGWSHEPGPEQDGYTVYRRGHVQLDVAFLACDEGGTMHTPLRDGGRGEWREGSFPGVSVDWDGAGIRVVSLASLVADKSVPRDDPLTAAKDAADLELLVGLPREPG